jgi:hypothetical protein
MIVAATSEPMGMGAVLSFWRAQGRLRPWIAMVAAYAFVLQALLGAVLVSQAAASGSDPFAICYASDDGTPVDHGKPQAHETCALCTLAKGSHAIIGADHVSVAAAFTFVAVRIFWSTERIVAYRSPTGQCQTGPPRVVFAA